MRRAVVNGWDVPPQTRDQLIAQLQPALNAYLAEGTARGDAHVLKIVKLVLRMEAPLAAEVVRGGEPARGVAVGLHVDGWLGTRDARNGVRRASRHRAIQPSGAPRHHPAGHLAQVVVERSPDQASAARAQ